MITGGTGFVGANFVRRFVREGNEVHLIVRESSDLWRVSDIREKLFLHTADITNKIAVDDVFRAVRPQVVLHFAAHGAGTAKDRNDAEGATAINLLGTVYLADAFAEFGGNVLSTRVPVLNMERKTIPYQKIIFWPQRAYMALRRPQQHSIAQISQRKRTYQSQHFVFFAIRIF